MSRLTLPAQGLLTLIKQTLTGLLMFLLSGAVSGLWQEHQGAGRGLKGRSVVLMKIARRPIESLIRLVYNGALFSDVRFQT